jgi:hypothetical protein
MQLTSLFVLLAAATLTLATPRPSPKECDVKTMKAHIGHGHESIVKGICSNFADAAGDAGDTKRPKVGKATSAYHRRMSAIFLNFLYS